MARLIALFLLFPLRDGWDIVAGQVHKSFRVDSVWVEDCSLGTAYNNILKAQGFRLILVRVFTNHLQPLAPAYPRQPFRPNSLSLQGERSNVMHSVCRHYRSSLRL